MTREQERLYEFACLVKEYQDYEELYHIKRFDRKKTKVLLDDARLKVEQRIEEILVECMGTRILSKQGKIDYKRRMEKSDTK